MKENDYILMDDVHKQLTDPERKAILQYLAFMGDYSYTSNKNYHYKLVNNVFYVVAEYRKDSPRYTLDELKLMASYFHDL